MYIMLPIFLFVFKKVKFKAIILAGLALLLLGVRIRYINAPVLPDVNIWNVVKSSAVIVMPYFIIGYLFTLPALKKLLNLQIAMFLLIFVAFVVLPNKLGQILAYAVLPYTVFSFALTAKPVFKNFGVKNDYTYGMYLYGFLVQQFILYVLSIRMGLNVPFYGYLILSLVGTFVFAFFSWHIVEKPMQKLSRILLKKLKRFSLSKRPPVIETDITEGA